MNQSDREIIISIVTRAFEENPRAQAMIKKKKLKSMYGSWNEN